MKKALYCLGILALCMGIQHATAAPITPKEAHTIAKQYLVKALQMSGAPSPTLYHTLTDPNGDATIYIYNVGTEGFLLVSADDLADPVLGYSFNGCYDTTQHSPAFMSLLHRYHQGITDMRQAIAAGETVVPAARYTAERAALQGTGDNVYQDRGKNVEQLLTSRWEQGSPYNKYCPVYTAGEGGHALVGCVATAMSQVVRYHGYPNTGFGSFQYSHSVYGALRVNFDSTQYNISRMPNTLGYSSSTTQINAVALLCYHCGVSVSMNYQHAGYTVGSGTQTSKVVEGLTHFGYMNAYFINRGTSATSKAYFDSLVLDDLTKGRPVICDGVGSDYGHAFVCDGYRSSNNKYHFNFGWGGYQDGYYTMDNANGFSSDQGAVLNIYPSGLANVDTLYIAADSTSTGAGTSWEDANPNLQDAINLASTFNKGPILVKGGTYYGDTTGENAFKIMKGVQIYGGFAGTESSIAEANPLANPTILSGKGERRVVYADDLGSKSYLTGLTIQDGYAEDGAGITAQNNMIVRNCVIRYNTSTGEKGAGLYSSGGATIINNYIYANTGDCAVYIVRPDNIKNCLVANNNGDGIHMAGTGTVLNNTIVSNSGTGVVAIDSTVTIRNNIIWNNAAGIDGDCTITFNAISTPYTVNDMDTNVLIQKSNMLVDNSENWPMFINPVSTRGYSDAAVVVAGDWQLRRGSPCINSGDTVTSGLYNTDITNSPRRREGRVDMGCYESQNVGIAEVQKGNTRFIAYPNPTSGVLHIQVSQPTTLQVFDMMGRLVQSVPVADQATLDMSHYTHGLYLLRATDGSTQKVVVQ